MFIVGLTGSLGTGKTTVARMFKGCGAEVINADDIVHEMLSSQGVCYRVVIKEFGKEILSAGRIDRKKLGHIVFKDAEKLKTLEGILHSRVRREIRRRINVLSRNNTTDIVVLDVPLLFESGMNKEVDCTVVVVATRKIQIDRATANLNISKAEVIRRIENQMPIKQKVCLADFIINNSESRMQTRKKVKAIWQIMLQEIEN